MGVNHSLLKGDDIFKIDSYKLVRQGSNFQIYDSRNRYISLEERFYYR